MKYYRFKNGQFVQAGSFEEAKAVLVERLMLEKEDPEQWHDCTCTGFQHRHGCPEALKYGIPF